MLKNETRLNTTLWKMEAIVVGPVGPLSVILCTFWSNFNMYAYKFCQFYVAYVNLASKAAYFV